MSDRLPRQLAELQRLQSAGGRRELGAFSMEGTRLVERALAAQMPLRSVLCSRSYAESTVPRERELMAGLSARDVDVLIASDAQIAMLIQGRTFGSILAVAALPAAPDLDDLLAAPSEHGFHPGVLVVIDATDPGNVGALLRTALASGARALVSVGSTDPFHPKAVRTSMGSLFRLPVVHHNTTEEFLAACGSRWSLCGAVSRDGVPLRQFRATRQAAQPIALCVGSEAFGLQADVCARLNAQLTIPMPAGVDSLSINAAAAVCLYELLGP